MIRLLFCVLLVIVSFTAKAGETGFKDADSRVSASYDVLRFFHWKFRLPEDYAAGDNSCEKLGFTEHIIAGTLISTVQTRLIQAPEPVFEEWYAGCTVKFAQVRLSMIARAPSPAARALHLVDTFGTKAARWLVMGAKADIETPWSEVPVEIRKALLAHLLEMWVGPEFVAEDLGLVGPESQLNGKPPSLAALIDLLEKLPQEAGANPQAPLREMYELYALTLLTLPELRIH